MAINFPNSPALNDIYLDYKWDGEKWILAFGGIPNPSVHSSEAAAFLVRTSGLDTGHINAYYALIDGLVTDGVWSKLDALYITATQNAVTAKLNLVSTSYTLTQTGTLTFTADRGFTGDNQPVSSNFLSTGFTPSTALVAKYTQNSCHISAWSVTNVGANSRALMGANSSVSSAETNIFPYDGSAYVARVQNVSTQGATNTDTAGWFLANRTSSTAVQSWKNNVNLLTQSSNSGALINNPIALTGGVVASGACYTSNHQVAMASIGSTLSSTDVANFYSRLLTYMTSLGGIAGTEAAAFLARTSGLDFVHINAYTALINGLVADGVWAKLDALYIYATSSSANALLNLVSTSYACTLVGSPTFTTDRGFTGVQTVTPSDYINTNFNPATASSPKYVQNSAHMSVWSNSDINSSGNMGCPMGQINGSFNASFIYARHTDTAYFGVNGSISTPTASNTNGLGHYLAVRAGASTAVGYKNGVQVAANSDASTTPLSLTLYVGAIHDGGLNAQTGSGSQISAASIGASLDATQSLALYNRLRTFMTAVGVP